MEHSRNTDINIFVTTFMRKEKVTMVYIPSVIRSDIDSEKEITACLLTNEAQVAWNSIVQLISKE